MGRPSFECVAGRHLHVDVVDEHGVCAGGWCVWCGTAAYDPDRITDDGAPVGFVPVFVVRVEPGWRREPADYGITAAGQP